jgi:predicted secreted hydrolase
LHWRFSSVAYNSGASWASGWKTILQPRRVNENGENSSIHRSDGWFGVLAVGQSLEPLSPAASATDARQLFQFQFPRDLYDHPGYQGEWWYFTGNLSSQSGRQYGFELTFFHIALPGQPQITPVIFADLAVSDLNGRQFFFHKALAPQTSPRASITEQPWTIQLGSWTLTEPDQVRGVFHLHALQDDFGVDLALVPELAPVLNGFNGLFVLDASATGAGNEYYEYCSIPRVKATGSIKVNGETIPVEGLAWNDHEFFNLRPGQRFPPWDWFSVQLDDGASIMLYGLRLPNGAFDPASRGTFVDTNGTVIHLRPGSFTLTPGRTTWHSAVSNADYPIEWTISIPSLEIELAMSTPLPDQEMPAVPGGGSPAYWEGASRFQGTRRGMSVQGKGYLEMLGYNRR